MSIATEPSHTNVHTDVLRLLSHKLELNRVTLGKAAPACHAENVFITRFASRQAQISTTPLASKEPACATTSTTIPTAFSPAYSHRKHPRWCLQHWDLLPPLLCRENIPLSPNYTTASPNPCRCGRPLVNIASPGGTFRFLHTRRLGLAVT